MRNLIGAILLTAFVASGCGEPPNVQKCRVVKVHTMDQSLAQPWDSRTYAFTIIESPDGRRWQLVRPEFAEVGDTVSVDLNGSAVSHIEGR